MYFMVFLMLWPTHDPCVITVNAYQKFYYISNFVFKFPARTQPVHNATRNLHRIQERASPRKYRVKSEHTKELTEYAHKKSSLENGKDY